MTKPKKAPKMKKSSGLSMSPCAFSLACAITRPWDQRAIGACIPSAVSVPSRKVRSYTRFNFAIASTPLLGFVYFTPTLANDGVTAFYTTATFAGTDASAVLSANNTLSTGISTASMSNLPYTTAQLVTAAAGGVPSVKGRVVSYGWKVTYAGTTSNEGGVYYCYTSNTHENITNYYNTPARLSSMPECEVSGVTRHAVEGTIYGTTPGEDMYSFDVVQQSPGLTVASIQDTGLTYPFNWANSLPINIGGNNGGLGYTYTGADSCNVGGPMSICYVSAAATGQFLVEIIQHSEFVGELAVADATPNHADPEGAAKVKAAAMKLPYKKNANPLAPIGSLMRDALMEEFAEVAKVGISTIAEDAGAALLALL
jgi:hypothetical protein